VSQTFWGRFAARAEASAQAPVLFDENGSTLTFGELREVSERVAAGLHAHGIGKGSRVTWQLPTRIQTVVLMLALNRLGAVQNPIIPLYGRREVGFAVRQTGAQLLVVPDRWRGSEYGAMARVLQDEIGPPLQLLTDDGLPEGDPATLPAAPENSAMRWVFYTSGTTADPKGVCHTDDSVHAAGRVLVLLHDLRPDDVGSIAFPIAHVGGAQYLSSMFEAGFPALLLERFNPAESLEVMRARGVTVVGGGSAIYQAVLAEQRRRPDIRVLPTLRKLTGGGTPKPPQLFFDVRKELGAPILHGLGMTESPCITMGAITDTDEQLAYTEGAPVPGMQVRVRRADGALAGVGEEGEMEFRGDLMTSGYVDPALNAASFTPDGWLRGGDLGRLREDGYFVITGRIKDIIIRKGENVSVRELEELLLAHPKIEDVAVIGLPDGDRGERVCAVVETVPGSLPIDLPEMQAFLQGEGLAVIKLPEQLEVLDALPRNAFSKVLKAELRARFS
jgi:cyclohexanecarboxylate-CoA ligase